MYFPFFAAHEVFCCSECPVSAPFFPQVKISSVSSFFMCLLFNQKGFGEISFSEKRVFYSLLRPFSPHFSSQLVLFASLSATPGPPEIGLFSATSGLLSLLSDGRLPPQAQDYGLPFFPWTFPFPLFLPLFGYFQPPPLGLQVSPLRRFPCSLGIYFFFLRVSQRTIFFFSSLRSPRIHRKFPFPLSTSPPFFPSATPPGHRVPQEKPPTNPVFKRLPPRFRLAFLQVFFPAHLSRLSFFLGQP